MAQNEKKHPNFLKRVLFVCFLGILFGLFAANTFYGIRILVNIAVDRDFLPENIPFFSVVDALNGAEESMEDNLEENIISEELKEEDVPNESVIFQATDKLETTTTNMVTTVTDVTGIVTAVMPAIVSIVNEYTVVEDYGYFGTYEEQYAASGTGIIVGETEQEIILVTNYHVIEDADRLEITFADQSIAEARVKGVDAKMDLAVITVESSSVSEETMKNIAVATLGNSDELQVGEPAIAIGNALGYGQSVTTGVISAVNRQIGDNTENREGGTFIQTDAAINPGNSGGALLNMKGEVVGINSSKIGGETIEGMGYAIPITTAMPILEDLMTKVVRTKVSAEERGYMGILGYSASDYSYLYDIILPDGVYVDFVNLNSPAQKAGILKGDVITGFGDYPISDMSDLDSAMWYYKKGESAEIKLLRLDKQGVYQSHVTEVVLGESGS